MDLRDAKSCRMLYERVKAEEIDILINNAGFGLCGAFDETSLDRELEMIDLNIRAVHVLTKLFLKDFIARDHGFILNVASIAAYAPGPLMATYYASKAYVLRLSQSIYGELRRRGSHVHVAALCPGPVRTEFQSGSRRGVLHFGNVGSESGEDRHRRHVQRKTGDHPGHADEVGESIDAGYADRAAAANLSLFAAS